MIRWLINKFFKEPEWPEVITCQLLSYKLYPLHCNGYSKQPFPYWKSSLMRWVPLFKLVEVPIPNCITDWVPSDKVINRSIVKKYAKMSAGPPIVFTYGFMLVDGMYRLLAARERGENTIMAYIPVEAKV
jgi:hypothetical protein